MQDNTRHAHITGISDQAPIDWCEVHRSPRSTRSSTHCLFASIYPAGHHECRFLFVQLLPLEEE